MNASMATERPAVAAGDGGGRRSGRPWRAVLVVIVVVAAAAAAFAVAGVGNRPAAPGNHAGHREDAQSLGLGRDTA
jgi:hypothetical protein